MPQHDDLALLLRQLGECVAEGERQRRPVLLVPLVDRERFLAWHRAAPADVVDRHVVRDPQEPG
jgi:hypothetical protein